MARRFYGDDTVPSEAKRVDQRQYEREGRKQGCSCQLGCFRLFVEIAAFVIICNIIGCDWAERATDRSVKYIRQLFCPPAQPTNTQPQT